MITEKQIEEVLVDIEDKVLKTLDNIGPNVSPEKVEKFINELDKITERLHTIDK